MDLDALTDALQGVAFTTPTPFTEDAESVDHDALAENLDALSDAGAELFVPCGNTGEYYALSREERIEVVRTHAETVGDRGAVVAGVGGSTKDAIDLIDAYAEAGADAAMVMNPDHTYVHKRGLVTYYRRLAESTDLGVVLYRRGPQLSKEVVADLAGIENVLAVKYAVNDVKDFAACSADVDGVLWLNGIAERYAPSFAVEGAKGFTTGTGNFVPEASLALFEALEDRDWERARRIRDLFRPFEDLREEAGPGNDLAAANNVPAVKFGMELAGLNGGPVREPLVDLAEEDRARARRHYERITSADLG